MRRLAFRRLLPIVQLVLAVGLLIMAETNTQLLLAEIREAKAVAIASEGVSGWDLEHSSYVMHVENFPGELCFAINWLPFTLGFLLWIPFFAFFGEPDWIGKASIGISFALMIPFWFLIGRVIDRHLDLSSVSWKSSPGRLKRWSAAFGIILFIALSSWAISWPQGPYPGDRQDRLAVVIWSGFGVLWLVLKLRRWQLLARAAASSMQP